MEEVEEVIDWGPVYRYEEKKRAAIQDMVFAELSATSERLLVPCACMVPGTRYALCDGSGKAVSVLVQVLSCADDLYFSVLASRDPLLLCDVASPTEVSVGSVFRGEKPAKTPDVPKTKEGWKNLSGKRVQKLYLWHLLCQFKQYSEYHSRTRKVSH